MAPRRPGARARLVSALAGLLTAMAAPAGAQVVVMEPVSGFYDWEYGAHLTPEYQGNARIDGGGSFDALRFETGIDAGGPISQTVRLFMRVDYTHTSYDFGTTSTAGCINVAACFTVSPWRNVHTIDMAAGASLVLNETIHVQAIVPLQWHAETGASRTGLTAGFIGLVRLRFSERFVTSLGIGVQSELEKRTSVFPVIALDWQISDGARLLTRGGPYQGADVALYLGRSQTVKLVVSTGWERRRFRINGGLLNPSGVAEYTSVPVLGGFELALGRSARLAFEGGAAVAGRLRLENANGGLLRAESWSTAGLVRGQLRVVF